MKNKHNLQRLIGAFITLIGIVFIIIAVVKSKDENQNIMLAFTFIGVPFILVGAIWTAIATSKSRKVCDKCGGGMKGCAYEYIERNRKMNGTTLEVTVHIDATCPHCGAIKSFDKKFSISKNSDNIQYQVDQFCKRHFRY